MHRGAALLLAWTLALPVRADGWTQVAPMRAAADTATLLATLTATGVTTWRVTADGLRRAAVTGFAGRAAGAAVADFDRDGGDELVLATAAGIALVEPAEAARALAGSRVAGRVRLEVGDVDGDHWPDVLALRGGVVQWWRNVEDPLTPGARTLLPDALPDQRWRSRPVRDVIAADLDGDGRQELVLAQGVAGAVVLVNAPHGLRPAPFAGLATVPAERVAVVDLDGDGRSDVVLAGRQGERLSVAAAMNRGAAGLELAARIELPAARRPWLGAIDWDLDGIEDVAVASGDSLRVLSPAGGTWRTVARVAPAGAPAGVVDTGRGGSAIVIGAADATPRLLAPARPPGEHWIGVVLEGHRHRPVVDASVVAVRRDGTRIARRAGGRRATLALGPFAQWDMLAVYWPGGRVVRLEMPGLDRYLTAREPDPAPGAVGERPVGPLQRWTPALECGVGG